MRVVFSSLVFIALAASSYVTAKGINCQGSSDCFFFSNPDNPNQSIADSLHQEIAAHVDDNRWYQNGEHIVCVDGEVRVFPFTDFGSICAFLQNTWGLPGSVIKTLSQRIVEHGCSKCGSVPAFFDQGDNDIKSHGELTFNFVNRVEGGDGQCGSIPGKCQYD